MRTHFSLPRRNGALAALAVISVASLAACSGGGSTGTGTPSSPTPSLSSTVDPSLKVPAPLPTQSLLSNPCSALTDAQLTQLGLASPGEVSQGPPALCGWSGDNKQNGVNAGPVPQNTGGISDIYDQKSKQAYFEPVTVSGYPGVFADTQDGRPSGSCTLWIGITDQLAYSVVTSITVGANKATTCASAQKVGEAVIAHLKGAA